MKIINEEESFEDGFWIGTIISLFVVVIVLSFVQERKIVNDNQGTRNTSSVRN
jgi:DNA polymerase sigma